MEWNEINFLGDHPRRMWTLSTAQNLWTTLTFVILIRFQFLLILSIENDVFCLIWNFYVIKLLETWSAMFDSFSTTHVDSLLFFLTLREYLNIYCIVYLNDILIYSNDKNISKKHVRLIDWFIHSSFWHRICRPHAGLSTGVYIGKPFGEKKPISFVSHRLRFEALSKLFRRISTWCFFSFVLLYLDIFF